MGLLVAATLATAVLGGCSWVKDPDAQPSAGASQSGGTRALPTERPTSMATAFNNPDATTFDEEGVIDAAAGEDVVVTVTAASAIGRALPSLDPTYTISASGGQLTDLHVDAESGTGYLLESANEAGSGTFIGEDSFTLTRFDLHSGESLDVATAVMPQDPQGDALPASARIVGIAGDVVVVEAVVGDGAPATAAIDIELDDVLWRERPARALVVAADRVLVGTGRSGSPGAVKALDLATGDELWRSLRGSVVASGVGATEDTATVVWARSALGPGQVVPLDLETGAPGKATPMNRSNWNCRPTSDVIAVCTLAEDDDVVGWDLAADRAAWSLPTQERFAPLVTTVQHDLVYGYLDSGIGVVLDALTGEDVASNTGAGPVAVNAWGGVVLYQGKAVFMPTFPGGESGSPDASPGLTPSRTPDVESSDAEPEPSGTASAPESATAAP